jgi:plastocyanin domain-containing protein
MKPITIAIIIAAVIIGGALVFSKSNSSAVDNVPANNVSFADGQQIIEIRAKGGYQPRRSVAKAGIPTILRFNTNGTFDCSTVLRIPALNLSQNLSPSGATDIDLGTPPVTTLSGTCGMGMYSFAIDFRN